MNITGLVIWMCETYEAKSLVGNRIGAKEWRNAVFATLVQVVMQENEIDKDAAETLLLEEIEDYYQRKN